MKHFTRFKHLVLGALFLLPLTGLSGQTIRSYPSEDAVAYEDATVEKAATNLFVFNETGKQRISYMKFNIAQYAGMVVKTAKLSIRGGAPAAPMVIKLTKSGDAFTRADLTWDNKPTTSGELATINMVGGALIPFEEVNGEMVKYINQKLIEGATEVSFAMMWKSGNDNSNWIGGTRDGVGYKPELELEFEPKSKAYPIEDAVAYEDPAETKHATNLFVFNETGKQRISYMKFDIAQHAGKVVKVAKLSIRGGAPAAPMVFKLTKSGDTFTRADITWDNKPSTSGELATLNMVGGALIPFEEVNGEMVKYINQKLLEGATEVSFAMMWKSGNDNSNWIGGTRDGVGYKPELELEFEPKSRAYPIEDAVAYEDPAETKHATNLFVFNETGKQRISYMKFDIAEHAGKVVKVAKLSIRGGAPAAPMVFKLTKSGDTFTRADITWDNKPSTSGELATLNMVGGALIPFEEVNGEMVKYINQKLLEGATEVSFAMMWKSGNDNSNWIGGRLDGVGYRPELELEFEPKSKTYPTEDAVAYETNETPHASNLFVYNEPGNQRISYMKFDIAQHAGKVVKVAKLSIRGGAPAAPMEFKLTKSGDTFTRAGITWETKPSTSGELATLNMVGGALIPFEELNGELVKYINQKLIEGASEVSFAMMWKSGNNNSNWIGGRLDGVGYRPELELEFAGYEAIVSPTTIKPESGTYVTSINVELKTVTEGASIYYTLDGTEPDETSTLYTEPFTLTATDKVENITLTARAFAEGLTPSEITSAAYVIHPVIMNEFSPSPQVTYQKSVTVSLSAQPETAYIIYTLNGADPNLEGEVYADPFTLTQTTQVRAIAVSEDGAYTTPVAEGTYEIVETTPAPGIGPGGVGFTDLTRENQPALSLWLRAHDITGISDGSKVNTWNDISGNANHAYNDESGIGTKITNTGENWKAAPTFVAAGPNNLPAVRFGTQTGDAGDLKNLIVNDADNLDGGSGISIFMVVKRNQLYEDFAALIQKRDITNQPAQSGYVLEMDGGANPNKMQFVIARDIYLKSLDAFNTEDYYIVNVGLNSKIGLAGFLTNGAVKSASLYSKPIQNTHAPVILGGFQPMDVAEVVLFNSDVNNAQTILIHNHLAAKYNINLAPGRLYTDNTYVFDLIGVGKASDLLENGVDVHDMSSGGGLEIKANSIAAAGDFVFAGHKGTAINDDNASQSWGRVWHIQKAGNGAEVTLSFDFSTPGVTFTPTVDYKLWYKADLASAWSILPVSPTVEGTMLQFNVGAIADGFYTIGIAEPISTGIVTPDKNAAAGITLYPNPASDILNLELNNEVTGNCTIKVISLTGQVVMSQVAQKASFQLSGQLNIGSLQQGTYLIRIEQGQTVTTRPFIKK